MTNKPKTFKVYPEKRGRNWGWYFVVKIHPSKEAFDASMRKLGHDNLEETGGLTTCHKAYLVSEDGTEERTRDIGHIHLISEALGSEAISHEATHAAIGWAREVELDPNKIFDLSGTGSVSDENERFCYAQGQITRQIVNKCYKFNLFTNE